MANLNLSQKTIDLLRLLAMPLGAARKAQYEGLLDRYGVKPVHRKLEELARRDYIEYGTGPVYGWLTPKGKTILLALDEAPKP